MSDRQVRGAVGEQMKRQIRMKFRGEEFTVNAERSGDRIIIERDGTTYTVELVPDHDGAARPAPIPAETAARAETAAASGATAAPAGGAAGAVSAPMTGTIKEVRVQPGDSIADGQTVIVMEAMKMEMEISAHRSATVGEVLCAAGDSVKEKQPLLTLA